MLKLLVLFALLILPLYLVTNRGFMGSLVRPLPFKGPFGGKVIDASSGRPVQGAKVRADWLCCDTPYPHVGDYHVCVEVLTDRDGIYRLRRPRRRGGWFKGGFTLDVTADGYIRTSYYLSSTAVGRVPVSTDCPSVDAWAVDRFPARLDISLRPVQ